MGIANVQGLSQPKQPPDDIDSLKKEVPALERLANPADRAKGQQMLMQLLTQQYDQRLDLPNHKFDATGMPFDAQHRGNAYSNGGAAAAQGVIQNNTFASIPAILARHCNDPEFFRNFFNTLEGGRTAQALRHLANDDPTVRGVDPKTIEQQLQSVAKVFSTLVRRHKFNQNGAMKNALATMFQQDYDGIVMHYRHDPFDPNQPPADKLRPALFPIGLRPSKTAPIKWRKTGYRLSTPLLTRGTGLLELNSDLGSPGKVISAHGQSFGPRRARNAPVMTT